MKTNQLQKNISKEWREIPVGDIFSFIKTYAISRENLSTGIVSTNDIGNIHYGDIHSTYTSTNIDLSKTEIPLIKDKNFKFKKEELLKDGDIIMADASEDYSGVSVTISVYGIGNKKVVGGLHTYVLRDEKGITDEYYRQYIFRNPKIRNKLQKIANGVSVYGVSKTTLAKVFLPIPSLLEQNRIVSVLETWDKNIENLNKKIEIKKQIKKGLMQDLLTGKKRLFGFKDNWKFVNLGETCKEIKTGKLDANAMIENGKYRFYTCAKDYYFIDDYAFDTEALLVSGNGANVGYVHYYKGKFNAYQRTYVLFDFTQNIVFIKYILDLFIKTRIKEEVREGNTPYITMDTLTDMSIKIPSIKEQAVIVEILTTADKEITELERKLEIVKEQKRYLLNNLITGAIRTPENLSVKS